jgi:hypothetical protein
MSEKETRAGTGSETTDQCSRLAASTGPACFGCNHMLGAGNNQWCYMFEAPPDILPCAQHDKFSGERQIMGSLICRHPEILAMMIMSISH